jgi:hypothetical protein
MKKKYMKPVVQAIVLQQKLMLLAGSDTFNVHDDTSVDPKDTW